MFPDKGHIYGGPSLSIKKKKEKKKIIKNNKKTKIRFFYFENKNRVQKNEIKDVYWPVTTKMATSASDPEIPNVIESWSYQYW